MNRSEEEEQEPSFDDIGVQRIVEDYEIEMVSAHIESNADIKEANVMERIVNDDILKDEVIGSNRDNNIRKDDWNDLPVNEKNVK
ncbi:hypothetical protein U1Q18_039625 [Sarracenia purpurea var. burkii]